MAFNDNSMLGFRYLSLLPTVPNQLNEPTGSVTDDDGATNRFDTCLGPRLGGRIYTVGTDILLFYRGQYEDNSASFKSGIYCWRYTGSDFEADGYKTTSWTPTNNGEPIFKWEDMTFAWDTSEGVFGNMSVHFTQDPSPDTHKYSALFTFKVKDKAMKIGSVVTDFPSGDNPTLVLSTASWPSTIPHTTGGFRFADEKQIIVEASDDGSTYYTLNKAKWEAVLPANSGEWAKIKITGSNSGTSPTHFRVVRKETSYHCAARMKWNTTSNSWSSKQFLGPIRDSSGAVGSYGTLSFFRDDTDDRLFAVSPGSPAKDTSGAIIGSEPVVLFKTDTTDTNDAFTGLSSATGAAFSWLDLNTSGADDSKELFPGIAYSSDDVNTITHYGHRHKVQTAVYVEGGYVYAAVTGGNTYTSQGTLQANDWPSYGKLYRGNVATTANVEDVTKWDEYDHGISFMRGSISSPAGGGIWGPQIFKVGDNYYAISEHVGAIMRDASGPVRVDASGATHENTNSTSALEWMRSREYGGSLNQYDDEITSNSLMLRLHLDTGETSLDAGWNKGLPFSLGTHLRIQSCKDDAYLTCANTNDADAGLWSGTAGWTETFAIYQEDDFFYISTTGAAGDHYLCEPNRWNSGELATHVPPINKEVLPSGDGQMRAMVQLVRRPDMDKSATQPAFMIMFADTSRMLFNDSTNGLVCTEQGDGNSGERACWYFTERT